MTAVPRLVIDTSVAVKWFFEEPGSDHALRLRRVCENHGYALTAPELLGVEFANVVWKRVVFHGLAAAEGEQVLAAFQTLPIELLPTRSLLTTAYKLAVALRHTVYDALFLAVGIAMDADFVTADHAFRTKARTVYARVHTLDSWAPA